MSGSARGREQYTYFQYDPLETDRSSTIISARSEDLHLRLTRSRHHQERPLYTVSDDDGAAPGRVNFRRDLFHGGERKNKKQHHRHSDQHRHHRRSHSASSYVKRNHGHSSSDKQRQRNNTHHIHRDELFVPRNAPAYYYNLQDGTVIPAASRHAERLLVTPPPPRRAISLSASPYNDVRAAGKGSPMMQYPPRSFIFDAPRMSATYTRVTPRTAWAQTLPIGPNPASKLDHFTESTLHPTRDVVTMNLRNVRGSMDCRNVWVWKNA
ncbi:unnamed protein product [Amoebophrya sp. A120]|nr:unnamed protein product [Amoebophrya sp. A120]|eukprot:GSA120T00015910001.1